MTFKKFTPAHESQRKEKVTNVEDAKMILRTHVAGHYLHQSEEFTQRNLRQLENCQVGNSSEEGVDILVTLPNFASGQAERIDAHVRFMCDEEGVTGAQVTVIYDDILCDDSAIYYEGDDFYALILEEIVSIAAMFP